MSHDSRPMKAAAASAAAWAAVLPAVRTLSGLDKSSAQLGAAVVRYLEKIRTDVDARNLLGDIIGDTSYPQSVRDLAAEVLNM